MIKLPKMMAYATTMNNYDKKNPWETLKRYSTRTQPAKINQGMKAANATAMARGTVLCTARNAFLFRPVRRLCSLFFWRLPPSQCQRATKSPFQRRIIALFIVCEAKEGRERKSLPKAKRINNTNGEEREVTSCRNCNRKGRRKCFEHFPASPRHHQHFRPCNSRSHVIWWKNTTTCDWSIVWSTIGPKCGNL